MIESHLIRSVQIGEIPVIRHTDELAEAAAQLATQRCAYVLPATMQSHDAVTLREDKDRIEALQNALNNSRPHWTATQFNHKIVTPNMDIGMHGNPPFDENPPGFMDYLQYHHTPRGSHVVTIAHGLPLYVQERRIANRFLTPLLHENKTMINYADPDTFQRATLGPGDSVVFRLNDPEDGLCLLHNFQTTSLSREIVLTALERWDLHAAPKEGLPPSAP
jgi:hypothetical protein